MSGDGEWDTNNPVVVGKYTQIRQKWLRVKTVKSRHDRRYKRRPLPCAKGREKKRNNKEKKVRTIVTTT